MYSAWSTHFRHTFFAGKNKKATAWVFFLQGKQKSLITKSGRSHTLHKISSKTLTSIYHFRVDSSHTLPWSLRFFLIFLLFTKRWIRVATRVDRFTGSLAALSCGKIINWRKTSVNRVTTHRQKKDLFLNNPASSS